MSSLKLNLGCGHNIIDGWVNIDKKKSDGIDLILDLEKEYLPFEENSVGESLLSHVIEHIKNPLTLMENLYHVTKPGGKVTIIVPHGANDTAWEDQTHLRAYFPRSFHFFSQPAYCLADYEYKADWQPKKLTISVDKNLTRGLLENEIHKIIHFQRNIAIDLTCELECVKPMREAKLELSKVPTIEIVKI